MSDEATGDLRIACVLPVGGESALLGECLESLRMQDRPVDQVIVVDDSANGSLPAQPGAQVLRSHGRGPYAARNVGWRAVEADVVLFLDVRSRPRPTWARRIADAFADPAVALAGTNIEIEGGSSLGAQVSRRHRFFDRAKYDEKGIFRPYSPTCNLAVRRSELQRVGGFREIRSGSDADLGWRITQDESRRLEWLRDDLMGWVPRDRLRDYFEQSYRYGGSHYALLKAWEPEGAVVPIPIPYREILRKGARAAAQGVAALLIRRDRREVVECLLVIGRLGYRLGYRRAAGADR